MKNNNHERVLAFNLATEISEEELKKTAGGSSPGLTYQRTRYNTNKHGTFDTDSDSDWD